MNNKRIVRASFSLLTSVLVVLGVIILNILVAKLPVSIMQKDVTSDSIYEISELSRKIANQVDKEVTIYWIVSEGSEDTNLQHFLERYEELSSYINVQRVDPGVAPGFVSKIADNVVDNSLYIVSDERARYIHHDKLYSEEYVNGYATDVNYYFYGDSCITSAIDYVVFGSLTNMYILNGHADGVMSSRYVQAIENLNINIKDLSLLLDGGIPEDADILFLCAPATDISANEKEQILDYLKNGGKLMLVTYPTDGDEHSNIEAMMSEYGVDAVSGYVLEGDADYMAGDTPYYLLPVYSDHKIVKPLVDARYYSLLFAPQGLLINEDLRDTLSVVPLIYSSDKAFVKKSSSDVYEYEEGDQKGQFIFATAIDETIDGINTRIVWISSDAVLDDSLNEMVSGGNQELLLNSLSYLAEKEESILAIHPKSLEYEYMMFTGSQGTVISIVLIGIIPLAYVLIGLYIYLRRKNK